MFWIVSKIFRILHKALKDSKKIPKKVSKNLEGVTRKISKAGDSRNILESSIKIREVPKRKNQKSVKKI
jgi:hypothetical protein